ncbi:MAG: aminoacyl-tRNA hydrolase [Gammaproteobacteria bacterium]|nr:MAG: aminoacyl-tRNA hydrolase [Gammaproteobacteria bacterium]
MSSDAIRIIIGLGNPGEKYEKTRHNAGFWFLDRLIQEFSGSFSRNQKFFGEYARIRILGNDCHLLKPHTFMNRSGQAVQAIMHYFKISPEAILVVHDDLDFDPGIIRVKLKGGHGGHNGLRDIISTLGKGDFARLRIGVGRPAGASGPGRDVSGYVLSVPGKAERLAIEDSMNIVVQSMPLIWKDGMDSFIHQTHHKIR